MKERCKILVIVKHMLKDKILSVKVVMAVYEDVIVQIMSYGADM